MTVVIGKNHQHRGISFMVNFRKTAEYNFRAYNELEYFFSNDAERALLSIVLYLIWLSCMVTV